MKLTYKQKFNKKYGFPKDKAHSLRDIARITGRSYKGIKQIFEKGEGAYYSNPQSVRKNVKSPQQWAYARVYSAVMGGKASKVDKKELNLKKKKMAVKYSKQRDFGAKGRKTLKLGGKFFTKMEWFTKKSDAKKYADRFRKKGKLARVVKEKSTTFHQKKAGNNVYRVLIRNK